MRESDDRFRLALQNSPVTVAIVDRELRYTWVYNCHPDLSPDQLLGRRLDEVLPAAAAADFMQIRRDVLTSGERLRREVALERSSGRVIYDVTAEPVRDVAGSITGVATIATDITARQQAGEERARLAAIVESSFDAIISRALDGTVTTWNAAAEALFGYRAEEIVGRDIAVIVPEGCWSEVREINQRLLRGEPTPRFDTVRLTKDGGRIDVSVTVSPIRSPEGQVVGASVLARDISERKRAEAHQQMLLAELSHRVRNTLAVVLSIASQTMLRSPSLEAFSEAFRGRIRALAGAHTLLASVNWGAAELRAVVEQALEPYRGEGDGHVSVAGAAVLLRPGPALTLSLVLHELATNAAKYGALARPEGRLAIGWSIEGGRRSPRLRLRWTETRVPLPERPRTRGFGVNLIERSVAYELEGSASLNYRTDGLRCEIAVPWTREIGELAAP